MNIFGDARLAAGNRVDNTNKAHKRGIALHGGVWFAAQWFVRLSRYSATASINFCYSFCLLRLLLVHVVTLLHN